MKLAKRLYALQENILWVVNEILRLLDFICSYLEVHLVKIVSFAIMALCCAKVSELPKKVVNSGVNTLLNTEMMLCILAKVDALHMIVVVMMLMCLLFGISALRFSFLFIGPYLGVLFLSKMVYQTKLTPDLNITVNCSVENGSFHLTIRNTILDPEWWGYEELKSTDTLVSYYKGYILVFIVMTMQTVIATRQKIARIDVGASPDIPHVVYLTTTRADADRNMKDCIKYLINYGFYKFGVEVTLTFCVFLMGYRMDVFSVLYGCWVCILVLPSRNTLSLLWPFFFATLLFSILWQYSMAVGLSKKSCFEYPWANQDALAVWMFLPSFKVPPNTKQTLVDFVLLLLIQRQQSVFELEKRYGHKYLGGSNKEVYKTFNQPNVNNPTPDHTLGMRSWMEVAKFILMTCSFRITLAFLFWNGADNVNILSLGYLVGAFVFLWIDYDLCLWPTEKILRWWNTLLGYTVTVILLKTILEFAGCVYWEYLREETSWFVELVHIHCTSTHSDDDASKFIFWDIMCFACVIFQRRYFKSYYFLHEREDVLGIYRLQEKGAKLMDELQELRLKEFQEQERKTLKKIKKNMNRIKAWQKRMQGLNYNEPTDHATAIYMGDYFMFEDKEKMSTKSTKSTKSDDSSSSSDEEPGKKKKSTGKLTMSEFIETVFKKQIEEAIHQKRKSDKSPSLVAHESSKGKEEHKKPDKEGKLKPGKTASQTEIPEASTKLKKGRLHLFLDNITVIFTRFFNRYSRDYRYIQMTIKKERKKQKAKLVTGDATPRSADYTPSGKEIDEEDDDDEEDDYNPNNKPSQKLLMKLLRAFAMFLMTKTELLCYMVIFFHTIASPTLISLPLPILVFLWGALTTIRPTTTFWTALIAYTEVTVVIKALFQNSIFPWNEGEKKASALFAYPPVLLGIHKDNQYVMADLFLLVLLFLHRYKLKTLGLWNRTREEETLLPQDLKIYKVLSSETDIKDPRGKRNMVYRRKTLISDPVESKSSMSVFKMAVWKCTSRATAKILYRGDKIRTKIRVKEIEGTIMVTHDGRRLQPTDISISQMSEEDLVGNVILRVYFNDIITDTKYLSQKLSWVQHFTGLRKFFLQILMRDWRVSSDYYTLMFIFEFLNFLLVFFGYSSFSNPADVESEDYFSLIENQVPPMYLFTIIAHFLVIITDRVLYLRKNVVGKLVLHIILVILVHIWMFIIIPIATESCFTQLYVPQTYYIFSCFYFLMSAYQLRVGYPMRVQGHFLSKKYGYVNYYAYKGLQFLPFFNQLRTLLDYLCTHSSLTMMEWIKMESIFQLVFENKCARRADIFYPSPRGEECPKFSKYCPGVFSILALFIVIWLPFLIFALFNTVALPNLPQEAGLQLSIGNFGEMFRTVATFNDVMRYTDQQFKTLQMLYKHIKKVWSFLSMYDHQDVGVLKFRYEPYAIWPITNKEFVMLNETVQNLDLPISLYLTWSIQRQPQSQLIETATGHRELVITKNNPERKALAQALLHSGSPVRLNNLLPKFIHVTNEGNAEPVSGFFDPQTEAYRNLSLTLVEEQNQKWWKLMEIHDSGVEDRLDKIPYESKGEITIFTFNEKSIPKLLLNVRKKGIFGLYLSMVFVTWTFIRRLMLKYPQIMFEDMPNPDPVLKICRDIYLARESHEFALEEDLYAKLLFLFRSPETMIKVTRLNTRK